MDATGRARKGEHGPVLGLLSPAVILILIAIAPIGALVRQRVEMGHRRVEWPDVQRSSARWVGGEKGWGEGEQSAPDRLHQTRLA